jgi:branched-chain amino acid transport system ATP-binding protein
VSAETTPGMRLEVERICAGYGGARVLHDLSMSFGPGSVISILGPNGAGKTTLVKVLAGLLKPMSGRLVIDGAEVARHTTVRAVSRGIAVVPEGRGIFPKMSVEQNLSIGAWARRHEPTQVASDIADVYSRFPVLLNRRKGLAAALSGGEAQMLAVGMALVARPRLVIFDEPSLGLAPKIIDQVLEECRRLADSGITVLLVEQNARKAIDIADQVYVVALGKIAFAGTSAEAKEIDLLRAYMGHNFTEPRPR